jgi:hypothetical protein
MTELTLRESRSQTSRSHVIHRGRVIPYSTMIEIKTRSEVLKISELIPQMWFGRTPYIFTAKHDNGTFKEVK